MEKVSGRPFALNAYQLKIIAIIAMLIDHIAWAFVPLNTIQGQALHVIGRLTAPIMCYFLAEGFYYTRDLKKYILRMGVFALISAAAFSFFESGGHFRFAGMGMIYTLFLGLLAITVRLRTNWPWAVKIILVAVLCVFSLIGDWPILGVLWPYYFAAHRGNPKKQFLAFSIVGAVEVVYFIRMMALARPDLWWLQLCQAGIFLAIPLCFYAMMGRWADIKERSGCFISFIRRICLFWEYWREYYNWGAGAELYIEVKSNVKRDQYHGN